MEPVSLKKSTPETETSEKSNTVPSSTIFQEVPDVRRRGDDCRMPDCRSAIPQKLLKFIPGLPINFLVGGTVKKEENMETQDFLRVINELDFILDDIDDISGQLDLTKAENNRMFQAISSTEKTKKILVELFPSIKSLDYDIREDLAAELMES
jgi:hypothetical protein